MSFREARRVFDASFEHQPNRESLGGGPTNRVPRASRSPSPLSFLKPQTLRAIAAHIGLDAASRMSLSVFVAHTGVRLEADPTAFESVDALRRWIANATTIPAPDQILLTEKGRHVKLPTLLIEVWICSL